MLRRILATFGQRVDPDTSQQKGVEQIKILSHTLTPKEEEAAAQVIKRGFEVTRQEIAKLPLLETEDPESSDCNPRKAAPPCAICCKECFEPDYRSSPLSPDCRHNGTICEVCIPTYLKYVFTDEEQDWNKIQCPNCPAIVPPKTVRRYLPANLLARFNGFYISQYIKDQPNFHWCDHGCRSGQVHSTGHDQPKMKCVQCEKFSCFTHECIWNEGNEEGDHNQETCQHMPKPDPDGNPEAATAATLKKTTRACPNCAVPIQRVRGCDEMYCTQCHVGFSWSQANRIKK